MLSASAHHNHMMAVMGHRRSDRHLALIAKTRHKAIGYTAPRPVPLNQGNLANITLPANAPAPHRKLGLQRLRWRLVLYHANHAHVCHFNTTIRRGNSKLSGRFFYPHVNRIARRGRPVDMRAICRDPPRQRYGFAPCNHPFNRQLSQIRG